MRSSRYLFAITLFAGFFLWYRLENTLDPPLTLLAILLHEGGHWAGAALCGVPLRGFRLVPWEARLSLGVSSISYKKECLISLSGPLANLLTFFLLFAFGVSPFGDGPLAFFATVSLSFAILNLLPIDDFDGGRLLRCFCAALLGLRASELLCGILSFLSLFCLWCASVYLLIRPGTNLSLFLFSATLFLRIFIHKDPR